jgi:hypothetical protein
MCDQLSHWSVWLDGRISIYDMGKKCSPFQQVHTDFGFHAAFCPVCTGAFTSGGGTLPGRQVDDSSSSSAEVPNPRNVLCFPTIVGEPTK